MTPTLDPFSLIVIILATLYLSYALTKTAGPFDLFAQIRQRFPLGHLTTCLPCAAFWISLVFYALWQADWAQPVVIVFAAAGAAVALANYVGLNQQ